MKLELRIPAAGDEKAFIKAIESTRVSDPNFAHYYKPEMSYAEWLELISQKRKGAGLEPNEVPSTFLMGFVNGEIVGRISIRHSLNDFLKRIGGHVGYVVLPNFRRRGYATEMLRQSLEISKKLNLDRVLLTCDQGNIGSQRTIENCGGKLENIVTFPDSQGPKMRFWIDLV